MCEGWVIDLTMVIDHGINSSMSASDEIAISKFKATCLAVIENVRKTGKPVRIAVEIKENRLVISFRRQPPAQELRAVSGGQLDPLGRGEAVIGRSLPGWRSLVEKAALESGHVTRRSEVADHR